MQSRKLLIKSERDRQLAIRVTVFFAVFLFVTAAVTTPHAYANGGGFSVSAVWDWVKEKANDIGLFVVKARESAENMVTGALVKKELKTVTGNMKTVHMMVDSFEPVYMVFEALGTLFLIAHFYIFIIRELQRSEVDLNFWIKVFVMFALSATFMLNLDMVFDGIDQSMSGIYDFFVDKMTAKNGLVDQVLENHKNLVAQQWQESSFFSKLKGLSFGEVTNFTLETGAGVIAMQLCNMAMYGVIYAIGIRMIIRRMFAPFAISDIASEGLRSSGFKYLKKYAAYYLQEIIIIFVLSCYFIFRDFLEPVDVGLKSMWTQIALKGAVTGIITGSGQIANEILGA